jgi:hypothetical protein
MAPWQLLTLTGIVLALLVNPVFGILFIVTGLAMLIWPRVRAAGPRNRI